VRRRAGGTGACQGQRRERDWAAGYGSAAGAGGAGPGGSRAPERARRVRMACTGRSVGSSSPRQSGPPGCHATARCARRRRAARKGSRCSRMTAWGTECSVSRADTCDGDTPRPGVARAASGGNAQRWIHDVRTRASPGQVAQWIRETKVACADARTTPARGSAALSLLRVCSAP